MAFINEIVSEEDIQKYQLDEIKKEFSPYTWAKGRPEGFWHIWTIDRERDIYLMPVKMVEEVGPSGRPEPTSKEILILNIKGIRVRILLDRVHCSRFITDSPFVIGWNLLEIDMPSHSRIAKEEIARILKEALSIYGYWGANKEVPNIIVEFEF